MINTACEVSAHIVSNKEISFRFSARQDPAALDDIVGHLLPLLQAQARAEYSRVHLDPEAPLNRHRAILALQMLVESKLQAAIQLLDAIPKLADGTLHAADFGFPEFDDNAPGWVE